VKASFVLCSASLFLLKDVYRIATVGHGTTLQCYFKRRPMAIVSYVYVKYIMACKTNLATAVGNKKHLILNVKDAWEIVRNSISL